MNHCTVCGAACNLSFCSDDCQREYREVMEEAHAHFDSREEREAREELDTMNDYFLHMR